MSIDTAIPPDAAIPDDLSIHETNLAGVRVAMPLLKRARASEQILEAGLPDNHSHFPGEPALIKPYYMSRGDPPDLGVWGIEAGSGENRLEGRLTVTPGPKGIDYSFSAKDSEGQLQPATLAQEEQLGSLLPLLK